MIWGKQGKDMSNKLTWSIMKMINYWKFQKHDRNPQQANYQHENETGNSNYINS